MNQYLYACGNYGNTDKTIGILLLRMIVYNDQDHPDNIITGVYKNGIDEFKCLDIVVESDTYAKVLIYNGSKKST